jgi:hypothetical protein
MTGARRAGLAVDQRSGRLPLGGVVSGREMIAGPASARPACHDPYTLDGGTCTWN